MGFLKKKNTEVQDANIGKPEAPPKPPEKESMQYTADDYAAVAHYMAEQSNVNLIIVAELRACRQELKRIGDTLERIEKGG